MGLFTPYKRNANKFNYIPRYYDPEKERREDRRAELRGERSSQEGPYTPGQYIRTQREARAARRADETRLGNRSIWKTVVGAALLLLLIAFLYPRLADAFLRAKQHTTTQSAEQFERKADDAFDQRGISDVEWQAQPITIVPNDYEGE